MASIAESARRSRLDGYFRFGENGTTFWRDTLAGATTFIVMSYIIFLNPAILSFAGVPGLEGQGLPFDGVLASTCLVAGVMTIIMGLVTNRAFAIAPGLGLNAVIAFTLVATEGLGFPEAMGIVVMEGALVTLLVILGMREKVMRAIPLELKKAIAIGIGLFIAFIGLDNAGLIVSQEGSPPVALADLTTWTSLVAIFGLVLAIVLRAIRFRGDLLVAIVVTTIFATIVNKATDYAAYPDSSFARWPSDIAESPNFGLVGEFSFDSFASVGIVTTLAFVFALFLADFFDTMGTIVGVGKQAGYLDKNGELPGDPQAAPGRLGRGHGGRRGVGLLGDDLHRVGGRGRRRRPHGLGQRRDRAPVLPVHVLRAADRDGPAAGDRRDPRHRRLADGDGARRRRDGGRAGRGRAPDARDRLPQLRARLLRPARDHHHALHVLDHERDRVRVHLLRGHPHRQGDARKVHPLMYAAAGAFTLYFLIPLLHDNLSWI